MMVSGDPRLRYGGDRRQEIRVGATCAASLMLTLVKTNLLLPEVLMMMMATAAPLYPHRKKLDGSSNLLCLNCLATIAEEQEEGGGLRHVCVSWLSEGRDTEQAA